MIMSDTESTSNSSDDSSALCHRSKKKLKSNVLYDNVTIKVEEKKYNLNRVQLALKSNYFEKLFVGNLAEKSSNVVEIRGLTSDTFSTIVNLMNGNDLESIMNRNNYLELLMGMDYLQMEIDLAAVERCIDEQYLKREYVPPLDLKVIELYQFTTINRNYRSLEESVLKYISAHLIEIFKYDEKFIFSLPFERFLKIIRQEVLMWCDFFHEQGTVRAKQTLSRICSKWICHDVENRIQHFPEIVNAANYGLYADHFLISSEKMEPFLDAIGKDISQERIEKGFQQLLSYRGEINPDVGQYNPEEKSSGQYRIVNKIDEIEKLTRFLNEGHLSDITIRAGAKTYHLHRYILNKASTYFSGPVPISSANSELVLDIDEKTFDLLVDFIYFDKIPEFDSNSKTTVIEILKAAAVLKSKLVIEKCCVPWMKKNRVEINSEDFIEFLNLAAGNQWQSESSVTFAIENFFNVHLANERSICKDVFYVQQICESAGFQSSLCRFCEMVRSNIDKMTFEDLSKTLHVLCDVNTAGKYSYLYITCLCKLIVAPRFESSVESHFMSISCDTLEDLLASEYFIISDPQQIVDICSKWIVHDVKNRYRLIPRIVFAINRNNSMDFSDFEANIPADLSSCSQEVVNEELWKLLNSNCLLSRDLGSAKTIWDFRTRPMFILLKTDNKMSKKVCVVDSELNEIVSLNVLLNHYVSDKKLSPLKSKISATLIGDTLFILCLFSEKFTVYAYNFSTKKLSCLGFVARKKMELKDALLNCNNQLYCCFNEGRIIKYSIELNRWLEIYPDSKIDRNSPFRQYGSDGNKLFKIKGDSLRTFDFEQSSWTFFASLPIDLSFSHHTISRFINFHNGIALFWYLSDMPLFLFNSITQSWEHVALPGHDLCRVVELVPYGEQLLSMDIRKGIQYLLGPPDSIPRWQFKKSAPDFELEDFVTIHVVPRIAPQSEY